LGASGVPLKQDVPLDGMERVHIEDPFGNRLELLERQRENARDLPLPAPKKRVFDPRFPHS
jgi:hypothetical protein